MIALLFASLLWTAHPASCTASGLLPDASCTPGAVATASLDVVCHTSTRGRRHVDAAARRRVLAAYGVSSADAPRYEVDHLVPLALGGDNVDANLWPEPIEDARRKDLVEDRAHAWVCAGSMPLEAAQRAFSADWTRALPP